MKSILSLPATPPVHPDLVPPLSLVPPLGLLPLVQEEKGVNIFNPPFFVVRVAVGTVPAG